MNQSEFNFLGMNDRVIAFMLNGITLWAEEPEIVDVVDAIKTERTAITVKGALESGLSGKGFTDAKNDSLDSFVAKTYKLCKKISAFAKKKGLLSLQPLVDISLSSLSRGPEKEVINRCKAITTIASDHLSELESFKVTTAEIDLINDLISDYNEHIDKRSTTNISKSSSGQDIANHIGSMRHQFNLLDDLVEGLLDEETFIRDYKAARMIDDFGKGKTLKNKDKPAE